MTSHLAISFSKGDPSFLGDHGLIVFSKESLGNDRIRDLRCCGIRAKAFSHRKRKKL